MGILLNMEDESLFSPLASHFEQAFPGLNWEWASEASLADLTILSVHSDKQVPSSCPVIKANVEDPVSVVSSINAAIKSGSLVLPTQLGIEVLSAKIHRDVENLRKLRDNNPMFLTEERILAAQLVDSQVEMCAHLLHPPAVKRYMPDLERVLFRRAVRTLQRDLDSWKPISPAPTSDEIIALYPKVPQSAEELRERLSRVAGTLEDLGVTISESIMDMSQLNVGIPFAGGHNRKSQGLSSPSSRYCQIAKLVASVMLRGAARAFSAEGEDQFKLHNTRVGVKSDNYQGAILNTTSHLVRQTIWEIMKKHGNNIFYFKDLNIPTVSGFRSQDNGKGKKRASYVLLGPGQVARTHVLDADDLEGKEMKKYVSTSYEPTTFIDRGEKGGRKRIVGNVASAQNDAIVPVPAYIAKYKDAHYKALYQQDREILSRFVSDSPQFIDFWTEGYESFQWVRDAARERGFLDLKSFLKHIRKLGEYVICGDVVSFDGNASWEIAEPFFRELLSSEALEVTKKLWDSDKIGVYVDGTGEIAYYYVSCNPEDAKNDKERKAIEETAKLMSSLPSGIGPTAQAGRGIVPTGLFEIIGDAFKTEIPNFMELLSQLPDSPLKKFSLMTALLNSAGNDHNIGSLVLWLLTGIDPLECEKRVLDQFGHYDTLLIEPEYPKMNAGWRFHEDDSGRCIGLSLSDSRLFANTIYPEYPRSANGLYHSVTNYVESAIGTPISDKMQSLAKVIVEDIYGFDSMSHLMDISMKEALWMQMHGSEITPQARIAAKLGIPQNDLEWKYSFEELIEMGVDEELLNCYRRPIPAELTVGPHNFLNLDLIKEISLEFGDSNEQ